MNKYEYKCIFICGGAKKTERILNGYGAEGWELVFVIGGWHYFKRGIE